MRGLVKGGLTALALFLAIQRVPIERENPPVEEEVPASPDARAVLRRACYDCHSNEEEVEEGEMPLWFYLPLHPEARLSAEDRAVLREWSRQAGGGRVAERRSGG